MKDKQSFAIENGIGILECEFESVSQTNDIRYRDIINRLEEIDLEIKANEKQDEYIREKIDNNTSHADKLDYIVSAGCGALAGLIDVFFVGEFSLDRGKSWSNRQADSFIMSVAKKTGYTGNRLDGAIKFLEDKFKLASDRSFWGKKIGVSAKSHHLDDFAHHPTLVGLLFSLATQFSGYAFFFNGEGSFSIENANPDEIGTDIGSKIYKGTVTWFFHLVSDMSGSNKTAGAGMGIPGPILALAKEMASLPGINQTNLPKIIDKYFEKEHFDLRAEIALGYEIGRQSVPVIINEVLVRIFYFIRHLYEQWKVTKDIALINWNKTLPFKNPTITRMLFIASGVFGCIDLADALIRSEGGLILRINFVNVGRFALIITDELCYAIKRAQLEEDYSKKLIQKVTLYNLKISYQDQGVWLKGEEAIKSVINTYHQFASYGPVHKLKQQTIDTRLSRIETILKEKNS